MHVRRFCFRFLFSLIFLFTIMEAINLKGLKIVDDEEELFIHTEVTNEEQPNLSLCLVGHFVTK